MAQVVVIGLGNPLLTDEGIGVHLLAELAKRKRSQALAGGAARVDYLTNPGQLMRVYSRDPSSGAENRVSPAGGGRVQVADGPEYADRSTLEPGGETPQVELVDLGTSAARILHKIAGKRKAVFVDCALMGEEPGTIRRFTPLEVQSRKVLSQMSLHEGDLLATLVLSQKLGECPAEIVIFGIQPKEIGPGESLSPELAARIEEYLEAIEQEIKVVSIECAVRE